MLPLTYKNIFITYLNFATLLIGVFAFFDFVIRFKRPLNFKIFYSILLFSLLFLDFLIWIRIPFIEIVKFSPIINFGIWCVGLYTLSILTTGRIEKWVWYCSGIIFTLSLYNFYNLINADYKNQFSLSVFSFQLRKEYLVINITRLLQRLILLASIVLLYKNIRRNKNQQNNLYHRKLVNWIGVYISFVFVAMATNIFFTFFLNKFISDIEVYFIIYSLICLVIFILTIYRPAFINRQDISKTDFNKFTLSEELKLTDANFFYPFFNEQYFLNKEATIEDFCKKYNIEEKESFNEIIINKYNMSFSNLINKHRVEYFIMLAKDEKCKNYSVEALSKEVGFNSRTALYKPFKKFHGGTPIEFIESLNN